MKTTKEMRDILRKRCWGMGQLLIGPEDLRRLLDDADRCEQLERVAGEMAECLSEYRIALHMGGGKSPSPAMALTMGSKSNHALARYEEVRDANQRKEKESQMPKQMIDGIPRRNCVHLLTPAEMAIRNAVIAVENLPADVRLTEAVNLLQQARDKVADFVESVTN